jgi:hypothetical protein
LLSFCTFLDACAGVAKIRDVRRAKEVAVISLKSRGSAPPSSRTSRKKDATERAASPGRKARVAAPRTARAAAERPRRKTVATVVTTKPPAPRTSKRVVAKSSPPIKAEPTITIKSAPKSDPPRERVSPEELLRRAMSSESPRERAAFAKRGLTARRIDRTTQAMLLRQLYLAYFESRAFARALEVGEQVVALGILPDVAHQDAARAAQALGQVDVAASHLRLAARISPPKRKAFHWWTLGSIFYLAGRYEEAISAMTRAARWGTTDKPLYRGHLALAQCASGKRVRDLRGLIERLADVPAGQGYGRFVLGQLAFYGGRGPDARRYLESFVRRSEGGRRAMTIALEGELRIAKTTLAALKA